MARKQYPLRIDPAIWEAVQRWADDEMRSANGQVEWILRDALKRAGRLPKKEDAPKNDKSLIASNHMSAKRRECKRAPDQGQALRRSI